MIIGGLAANLFHSNMFVPTKFYMQDEIVWCVSRAKPISKWKAILYLTQDNASWICGWVSLFLAVTFTYILSTFEPRPFDYIEAGVLIAQGMLVGNRIKPKRTPFKILVIYFMFIGILLTTIFNAFLMNYLTGIKREEQISSFDDLKLESFHFAAPPSALKFLKRGNWVRILGT